jgi:hypothetical protein
MKSSLKTFKSFFHKRFTSGGVPQLILDLMCFGRESLERADFPFGRRTHSFLSETEWDYVRIPQLLLSAATIPPIIRQYQMPGV